MVLSGTEVYKELGDTSCELEDPTCAEKKTQLVDGLGSGCCALCLKVILRGTKQLGDLKAPGPDLQVEGKYAG
ncbi:unnamed protein product [Ilex paraguariensis]|uniref:HMA domain-containing protein n=1 Tax=Ilex paraguariensis TaxID=185542 RepID=A0ABC8UDG9_9AQUA